MRILTVTAAAVVALAILSCGDGKDPVSADPGTGDPGSGASPFGVARAADVERQAGAVEAALLDTQAASSNRFAVALYHRLVQDGENLFFSPYSVSLALGMTAAGARGRTARQMRQALQVGLEDDAFHQALGGLEAELADHAAATEGVDLQLVNSLWAQTGFDLEAAYLNLLARAYGAGVNLLDFVAASEASRQVVNDWVSQQTRGRIEDLLPPGSISPQTRLVLTNAVYFLGRWRYRFDPELTATQPFHRPAGDAVPVPLMQLGGDGDQVELRYARDVGAAVRAIDLCYGGERLCMSVLLPDAGAFADYEAGLTPEEIDGLLARLQPTLLPPVRLPRFSFASPSMPLRDALQALGMRDAFDPGAADFSGIDGRRDLSVAQVLHKAFVAVDEEGTEAAAATGVVVGVTSVSPEPPRFVADRPFIFLIRDTRTGLILFMGRLVDPEGIG